MLFRKISNKIKAFLQKTQETILIIDGARQIGKSYIIRYVGQQLFKNFVEINMEEDKVGARIFADAKTTDDFYIALSIFAGNKLDTMDNTLVFIDEIQAYDHLLTLLKFLKSENRFTYIASGSQLGIALKTTSSIPLGSITIERMYPLDFEEFLLANGVGELAIETMRQSYQNHQTLSESMHLKMMDLFKKYLIVGGMPAVVNSFLAEKNVVKLRSIQDKIHALYGIDASKYESDNNKRLKVRRIFDMLPSNLENKKKRIVAKEVENKEWKRMESYADEFDYLISSGIALDVRAISNPRYPLVESVSKNLLKLYLNDVGLLSGIFYKNNIRPILQDELSINLGSIYETVVAQELRAHGFDLFYYDNKKNGEVDYLVDDVDNLSLLPIEVKSGKDYTVHSALDKFLSNDDYTVHRAIVLSNSSKVFTQDNITYLPIYYVMFLENISHEVMEFPAIG